MKIAEMLEKTDGNALAIRNNIAQVESALSEFDKISAGLADLNDRFPPDLVYDVTTTKGMAEAIAHRAAWREPRINVEKFRKTAKAPVLALGKDIDARAVWLTEQLLAGETPVHEQIKAEEQRKEAEKQQRILAEFARVERIQEAIADLHMEAMAIVGKPSTVIRERLNAFHDATLDPMVFQEQMAQAKAAKDMALAKMEQALKAQMFSEAEAEKLAAERAELAQLRQAAAAQRAKDEAAATALRQAEQERMAAEQQAAREAQRRLDAEAAQARAAADAEAAAARKQAQAQHEAAMAAERKTAEAAAAKALAKKVKAETAEKKLRDAAPVMLAALRKVQPVLIPGTDEANAVENAINAAA